MNRPRSNQEIQAMAEALGPAEKLVNLIINFPDHLWHNRPGVIRGWGVTTRRWGTLVRSIRDWIDDRTERNWNVSPMSVDSF